MESFVRTGVFPLSNTENISDIVVVHQNIRERESGPTWQLWTAGILWAVLALIIVVTVVVTIYYRWTENMSSSASLPKKTSVKATSTDDTRGETRVKATNTSDIRKATAVKATNTEDDVMTIDFDITEDDSARRFVFEILKTLHLAARDL